MRRRVLLCLTLISLSACNGDKIGQPISSPVSPPSRSISDGTFALGNPDFFFLPPMVKNPSSSPNWTAGGFNGTLHPVVHICEMTGTTEATATLTSTCSDLATNVSLTDEQYFVNWQVPSSSTVFYRLSVVAGTKVLGWADVETATNASQLKNVTTGEYVPLVDGRTLPVKFRIERYALCDVPGTGPCASSTVDLSSGGTVSTTVVANGLPAGITIPAGAGTTSTTITVQTCPDLPLDSPLFGTCVRVTADPALPPSGFAVAATVFICDVNDASVASRIVDHAQSERITLHRLDPGVEGSVITALPHAPACGTPIASTEGSLRGMLAALRRGSVGAAAREALSMLAPKPLYAARFIDLGGGGFTSELSDFQFALPSKMEVVSSTDGQSGAPGSTLALSPTVLVTDLGGTPVRGARIHFSTKTGSVADESVLSDVNGKAGTPWTIATGSVANLLYASGRGIASPDNDGPRDTFDPFQPIQPPFDPGSTNTFPVTVGTGSVTFTAHAIVPGLVIFNDVNPFDDAPFNSNNAAFNPNNVRLVQNLLNFTGTGPRASGNTVVMEGGHASLIPVCWQPLARAEVANQGYTLAVQSSTTIGAQPANVKVLILCLPTTPKYSADEINNMKQFLAEGGRLIYIGEHEGFAATLTNENVFLTDIGAAMRITPDFVQCNAYFVVPATSLLPHQITTGMSSVTMACSSTITTLGPNDAGLYYNNDGTKLLAGVASVDLTPKPNPAFRAAAFATSAPAAPTTDTMGNPINP